MVLYKQIYDSANLGNKLCHDRVKSSEFCLVWKTENSCSCCKDDFIKHHLHVNNLQKVCNK
jgi:hypothetical protein